MPVETLRPSDGRLAGVPFTSAMPFRILNKGPEYFRRQAEPAVRKLSAVERLEADKAKYVKSQQVALNRQAPIRAPIIRKPLVPPLMLHISTPPARKAPRCPADVENAGGREAAAAGRRGPALNLEILNNLINDVCDGAAPCSQASSSSTTSSPSPSSSSPSSGAKSIGSSLSAEQERSGRLLGSLKPLPVSSSASSCTSSPLTHNNNNNSRTPAAAAVAAEVALRRPPPPPVPSRGPRAAAPPAPYGSPSSVTVRRVDVRPHAEVRKPPRLQPQLRPRQTAQGQVAHPHLPPPPPPPPPPHNQPKPLPPPPAYLPPSPLLVRAGVIPPASPAFTRISNASSRGSGRKPPSLHRSKSDLSDRYSRATADLERFFNYCGLDPAEVEGLGGVERFTRANSDIVSVSKLRSVSTPSSEAERGREEEEEEEEGGGGGGGGGGRAADRVPYGISVIERNARVIKWLYGIRQARDAGSAVSNV